MTDERLSALLDGELTDAEVAELEEELATSPQLRADLADLRRVRDLLRSMGDVEPSAGLFDSGVVPLEGNRRRRARWTVSAAAVAGVAAMWLLVLGVFSGSEVARFVPTVDDYVDRHTAALEVGESDGFVAVGADAIPSMADEDSGLDMMGAYQRDQVVQAVYTDGVHEISVYREPGRVDWDAIARRAGSIDETHGDREWHLEAHGMAVVVVERDDTVVTVVADPGMDDMMMSVIGA